MYVCGEKVVKGKPVGEITQQIMDSFDPDDECNFEQRYLDDLMHLFFQTLFKLKVFLNNNNRETAFLQGQEGPKNGWEYLNGFTDDSGEYKGATGFSCFSYEKQGGYRENPQFLFGTAYQFL